MRTYESLRRIGDLVPRRRRTVGGRAADHAMVLCLVGGVQTMRACVFASAAADTVTSTSLPSSTPLGALGDAESLCSSSGFFVCHHANLASSLYSAWTHN